MEPASLTAVSDREEHVVRNQKKNVIYKTSNNGEGLEFSDTCNEDGYNQGSQDVAASTSGVIYVLTLEEQVSCQTFTP